MDIQKYIDSGILEEYILGMVSPAEAKEIEKNLQQSPELRTELNKIEDALSIYAQAKAKPMPEGLSEQILQSIENLEGNAQSDASAKTAKPSASNASNILGIALGIALLGTLLSSFYLYQQQQNLQNQLVQSNTRINQLNTNLTTLQLDCDQNTQQLQEQLNILKNPNFRRIQMAGTTKAPDAIATVHFNPNNAGTKTFLDLGTLPSKPTDMDYQLWAIVDGVPTDMGVIDMTTTEGWLIIDQHFSNPQAFAVTLETKGGNPTPNLEELYVIGNV